MALALLAPACKREVIAHEQPEKEANQIIYLLGQNGIDAEKMKDEASREPRYNVSIDYGEKQRALGILQIHNLPMMSADDTLSLFKEGGMIPTNQQERAKREAGIRGDVMNALRKVPRVIDVQASITMPEDNPLRDPNEARPKPKAAIILNYLEDGTKSPPLTVEDVQRFVQAALPDVKSSEVSVNMFPISPGDAGKALAMPQIDPMKGCLDKEVVIGLEVCAGNTKKVYKMMLVATIVAGLLSAMMIFAVLRAMRYRKDLTRLTAQFEKVKGK